MARPAPQSPAPNVAALPLVVRAAFPLLLVALAAFAFWPCVDAQFVALDDDANFEMNFLFRGLGPAQLEWMWSGYHYGHWHPLTWWTFGLDYVRAGLDAPAFHRTSLVIHLAGVLAFWALALEVLRWCAGWVSARSGPVELDRTKSFALHVCAAFATVAWAVHPLRVENVAWVTERRDLLSALFLFVTVLAYLRSARAGSVRGAWLALALVAYALSLASKAWGMTLPVVLLALDVYPLRRLAREGGEGRSWGALVLEKLWFVPFAAWTAWQASAAQRAIGATVSFDEHGLLHRAAQASYGLCFYVLKTLWPTDLGCHYLLELGFDPLEPVYIAAMVAVVGVTVALFLLRKRWPALFAAWFLYGVLVSPVLGLLQSGSQKVADRYAQVGSVPLVLLAAGALLAFVVRDPSALAKRAKVVLVAALALGGGLAFASNRQTRCWNDSESLFRQAVKVEPDNYFVLHNLSASLYRRQAWDEAIELERRSVTAHPGKGNELARHTLGILLQYAGRLEEAEQAWRDCVEWEPDPQDPRWAGRPLFWLPDPSTCLAALRPRYQQRRQTDELIALYERGLARRPDVAQLYVDLDQLLAGAGRNPQRLALWEKAEKSGNLPRAQVDAGRARALVAAGQLKEAEPYVFRAAAAERGKVQELVDALAKAAASRGVEAGIELLERARRSGVPASVVDNAQGKLYLAAARYAEAEPLLLRAQALDNFNRDYVVDVCELFAAQGRRDDAVRNLRALLEQDAANVRARTLLQRIESGSRR
ncbi:MAG: tetratricopeptide repeat protein [Planctomycetota bacterium]|nr:tetratricopeptide repeat protein [Planctomycetota bacterium]